MGWITSDDLRKFIGNNTVADEALLQLAIDTATDKVTGLFGPIPWAQVTNEYVEASGVFEACLQYRATRGLVSVADQNGNDLGVASFRATGRVVQRKDGRAISSDLLVTYLTGYFDASDTAAVAPAWARSAALHIGQQYLATSRKFANLPQGPSGFFVPNAVYEEASDYLLAPWGR